MKRTFLLTLLAAFGLTAGAQKGHPAPATPNTLLWRVSGKNLTKPSYLFGTMHLICASDIELSDSLRSAIRNADKVYLEIDMTDMMQMMSAFSHMNMREDTTLSDLLSKTDYEKVKTYFEAHANGMIPFSMLEKFKPMLVGSLMMENGPDCESPIMMEQLITQEAADNGKQIKGLETMDYQLSIFDSIPYKFQAEQLVKMVNDADKPADKSKSSDEAEMQELTNAYREQQLDQMDELIKKEDMGIARFTNLLLYQRNANWAKKLETLMEKNQLVVAVGAGHLPGDKGVINLLRKAGYKVEPVRNDMIKKKSKTI